MQNTGNFPISQFAILESLQTFPRNSCLHLVQHSNSAAITCTYIYVRTSIGLPTYEHTFLCGLCVYACEGPRVPVCYRVCTHVFIYVCIYVRAPPRTLNSWFIRRVSIKFNAPRSYNVRTTSPKGQLCHVELDMPVPLSCDKDAKDCLLVLKT